MFHIKRSPVRTSAFDEMFKNMETVVNNAFKNDFGVESSALQSVVIPVSAISKFPHYDLYMSSDGDTVIEMALAGYDKNDIDIQIADKKLIVKSKKQDSSENGDKKYFVRNISKKSFEAKFDIISDKIEEVLVDHENGILTITVVKDKTKPETPPIKISYK
jgi:molecular chaperone IbpA